MQKKPLSLSEWLQLLETRHPLEIDLGLGRIAQVADRLPLQKIAETVISVAGTNGKGSCIAILENLLLSAGYTIGSYTSPHFINYNERICINGQPVTDQIICQAFEQIEQARGDISLTYFEFGTLAAMLIMAQQQSLDVALLEVGLGGRLDAVNLVDSDIAIVTGIALDHQDWLGDDLNTIAYEKASIARPHKPLIYGEPEPYPSVIDICESNSTKLLYRGRDFDIAQDKEGSINANCVSSKGGSIQYSGLPEYTLPTPSLLCALQAASLIENETGSKKVIDSSLVAASLERTKLSGRFQRASYSGVDIILDVAHNPAAAERLAKQLERRGCNCKNNELRAVIAVMGDKDIEGILTPLKPFVTQWFPALIPEQSRAADSRQWQGILGDIKLSDNVEQAFEQAIVASNKGDTVLVFGSFFTVAPVLRRLAEVEG